MIEKADAIIAMLRNRQIRGTNALRTTTGDSRFGDSLRPLFKEAPGVGKGILPPDHPEAAAGAAAALAVLAALPDAPAALPVRAKCPGSPFPATRAAAAALTLADIHALSILYNDDFCIRVEAGDDLAECIKKVIFWLEV
jgi:hypothetical protein